MKRQEEINQELSGIVALMVAENTPMTKVRGERDTEFVKRIVGLYLYYDQYRPEDA